MSLSLAPAPTPVEPPVVVPHSTVENTVALLVGTFLVSLGLYFMELGGVVTGGTAGVALLIGHLIAVPFGVLYFAVTAPFLVLAVWQKGWAFTLRTALSLALVAGFSFLQPMAVPLDSVSPVYGMVVGNLLAGLGMLVLFRHGASLGGFNVIALLCQERLGLRAGYVQLALDLVVIAVSFTVLPWPAVLLSAAGAVVLNVEIAMNHRPGRYRGV